MSWKSAILHPKEMLPILHPIGLGLPSGVTEPLCQTPFLSGGQAQAFIAPKNRCVRTNVVSPPISIGHGRSLSDALQA